MEPQKEQSPEPLEFGDKNYKFSLSIEPSGKMKVTAEPRKIDVDDESRN